MIADLLDKPCSQVYTFYLNDIQINEKKNFLQRQLSTASSDSIDMKINGEHKKKKINGNAINTNHVQELIEGDEKIFNGNDNQQSVRILS